MPFGATSDKSGVRFRMFAPAARHVSLRLEASSTDIPMNPKGRGWYECRVPDAGAGTLYRYVIDGAHAVPDPASRFQPRDVNGPSEAIAPDDYDWDDGDWRGRPWHESVIYELHVGTFTREGTYRAAMRDLGRLARLGITAVELMPLADFAGSRNWGYDGVLPYAPDSRYGRPEDLKDFVVAAHRLGMMVLIDVVYNHFGPEGNYLALYAPCLFRQDHTAWGQAIDFGGMARRFFIENALYWLIEYNADGLRLDAVHAIIDSSSPDFLTELASRVRNACHDRHVHLILENDKNEARYLARASDGATSNYTAQWNDDFHHAMHVALTGETDGYYADYADAPVARLGRALAQGFAYQGEWSGFRRAARGEASTHLPPLAFVNFIQNHDQIGNRALGERLISITSRAALKAAAVILLLAPSSPLLFMGEEVGATSPFLFFCDFTGPLADAVREGRRREFARFPAFATPQARDKIPDPLAQSTFDQSRIVASVAAPDHEIAALYEALLDTRHREIVPRLSGAGGFASQWQSKDRAISVCWRMPDGSRLTLVANLSPRSFDTTWPRCGRAIWGTVGGATLPPWTVNWLIET